MYSLPIRKTVNAPTIEAVRQKKNVRRMFFQELDLMILMWSPWMESMVNSLKKKFEQSPVVAIDLYLSGITDPRERQNKRNMLYNIKSPR